MTFPSKVTAIFLPPTRLSRSPLSRPMVLAGILRAVGYDGKEVLEVLDDCSRREIVNDNGLLVGRAEFVGRSSI